MPLDIVEHLRLHIGVFECPEEAVLSWMPKIPVKSKDLSLLRGQRPHLILPKVESHALPFPAQDHHQQELEVDAHTKAQNATKKRHERAKQPPLSLGCVSGSCPPFALCGWAGLVLLLSSVAGLCVQALSSSCPLWLGSGPPQNSVGWKGGEVVVHKV